MWGSQKGANVYSSSLVCLPNFAWILFPLIKPPKFLPNKMQLPLYSQKFINPLPKERHQFNSHTNLNSGSLNDITLLVLSQSHPSIQKLMTNCNMTSSTPAVLKRRGRKKEICKQLSNPKLSCSEFRE